MTGHANFGPARLSTSSRQRPKQVGTAIHEVMHALGFSSSRYRFYRKPDNGDRWGEANVVESVTENGHTVTKIITPNVVEKAKKHFGCDNWPNAGLQLEDAGGSGTACGAARLPRPRSNVAPHPRSAAAAQGPRDPTGRSGCSATRS